MDELYEMDGTNLVSERHLWTVRDGWYKPCLWETWMNGTRWMVPTLSLRDMDELYEMDGTNLVSERHGWTVRDGWYKPCLWETWMNCTRWMVQTLSLRDMDERYELDGTNLVSKSHGHRTIGITQHSNRQYKLYEYGDNSGEPTGEVTWEEGQECTPTVTNANILCEWLVFRKKMHYDAKHDAWVRNFESNLSLLPKTLLRWGGGVTMNFRLGVNRIPFHSGDKMAHAYVNKNAF